RAGDLGGRMGDAVDAVDGARARAEQDQPAGALPLEKRGDLLLEAGAAEEAGRGVDGVGGDARRDVAAVDERGAHAADREEGAMNEGRLVAAVERAGADLHGDA